MCARRFLAIVFVLILLAVGGAFAIYMYGQQVLIRQATPRGHFTAPANGVPDYASAASWIARPELPDNPSEWLPEGVAAAQDRPAAIFYVHPTTYLQRDRWNAPLAGNRESDDRAELFVRSQASALTSAGRVWAPRYRQAAYGSFLLKNQDARQALDLAYADVRAAFDQFLGEIPKDQPLILAGHSQGSLHLTRLLLDRRDVLKGRLIAAYVVGWPVSALADLPAMGLRACSHPEETACLLSWQTFAEPANPALVLDAWEGTRSATGVRRARRDMVCVNPITGTRDGQATPQSNAGTLVPSADFSSATLAGGQVGAHCLGGFLMLDGEIPPLGPFVLPGNNYHVYDYALFWGAIRADAERRVAAWQQR